MTEFNVIGSGIVSNVANRLPSNCCTVDKHVLGVNPYSLTFSNENTLPTGFVNLNTESVVEDIEKSVFSEEKSNKFLLVDLLDCRLKVKKIRIGEKLYTATDNNGLSKLLNGVDHEIIETIDPFQLSLSEWQDILKKYAELIRTQYDPENVIVLEAKSASDCVYSNDKLCHLVDPNYAAKIERFYERIYTIFNLVAPDFKFIPCPDTLWCEASEYKPFSFYLSNIYYNYAKDAIIDIIENNSSGLKNLLEKCNRDSFSRLNKVDSRIKVWKDVTLNAFSGVYSDEFGNVIKNEGTPVDIILKGKENRLTIGKDSGGKGFKIFLGNNNEVTIGKSNIFGNNAYIDVADSSHLKIGNTNNIGNGSIIKIGNNSHVEVGDNNNLKSLIRIGVVSNSCFSMGNENIFDPDSRINVFSHCKFTIGNENYFNSGFHTSCHDYSITAIGSSTIWAQEVVMINGDGHSIFDIETGLKINDMQTLPDKNKTIMIRDHAWIAKRVTLLNGADVGVGTIVGACSLAKKKYPNNCVVVGNPGRVVKRNVAWCRNNGATEISSCEPYVNNTVEEE